MNPRLPPEIAEKIRALYVEGLPREDICRLAGVSMSTVYRNTRDLPPRGGWGGRRGKRKRYQVDSPRTSLEWLMRPL